MRIVIVGAGTVGTDLAIHLSRMKHDIALVEADPARCAAMREKLDVLVVEGSGSSPNALAAAGIAEADTVLAVTSVDEVNVMACGIARQAGVAGRIARIRSRELVGRQATVDLSAFGVTHSIDPERIVARMIDRIAGLPDAIEVFAYHDEQIIIVRHLITAEMPVAGKALQETVARAAPHRLLAVVLKRGNEVRIPSGSDVLTAGDDVTTVVPRDALPAYLELLGLTRRRPRKAVISGDGLTAVLLAELLRGWLEDVTLVVPGEHEAQRAAARLDGVEVILGSPTDQEVLREVNAGGADLYAGAGKLTTENVMSALLARSEGTGRVFAISYEPQSNRLFRSIGVHHVISPRRIMAQEIMNLIHRGRISMELQLRDLDLEAAEIQAAPGSPITRGPLIEVWQPFKRRAIAGAVIHEGRPVIPGGDTRVQAGDDVIVITEPRWAGKIQRLFG